MAPRFGTIYPCQTLNSGMDFSTVEVPLCVEGGDGDTEALLLQLATQLSEKTLILHEEERRQLHLAAVFACNFTNALYGVAFDLLKNAKIEPHVLLPLLQNSLKKLNTMTPEEAQTGPAVRNDKNVINKHLDMLNIEDKLGDLTNIILKYLPGDIMPKERISLLFDIFQLSSDLNTHAVIEDKILIPFVETLEKL